MLSSDSLLTVALGKPPKVLLFKPAFEATLPPPPGHQRISGWADERTDDSPRNGLAILPNPIPGAI